MRFARSAAIVIASHSSVDALYGDFRVKPNLGDIFAVKPQLSGVQGRSIWLATGQRGGVREAALARQQAAKPHSR